MLCTAFADEWSRWKVKKKNHQRISARKYKMHYLICIFSYSPPQLCTLSVKCFQLEHCCCKIRNSFFYNRSRSGCKMMKHISILCKLHMLLEPVPRGLTLPSGNWCLHFWYHMPQSKSSITIAFDVMCHSCPSVSMSQPVCAHPSTHPLQSLIYIGYQS